MMASLRSPTFLLITSAFVVCLVGCSSACNEAVCASLVSKCMLLKSCECNMIDKKNCTCCRECHKCLAKLYTECCDCVGMCPEKSLKESEKMSSVEELHEAIPELFNVLTEEEDPHKRWTVFTYPAHLDHIYYQPGKDHENGKHEQFEAGQKGPNEGHHIRHGNHLVDSGSEYTNCSVAYMSQCMSLSKCKMSCQSMGAARYRWFHQHGCCECVGSSCLYYGKGEALCLKCPLAEDEVEEEENILDEMVDENDEDDEDGDEYEDDGDEFEDDGDN